MEDNGDFAVQPQRICSLLAESNEAIKQTVKNFREKFADELELSQDRIVI